MKRFFSFPFFLVVFFLLFISLSYALTETSMNMVFFEQGSVMHYYGKYHVVHVNGSVTITNPSSTTYFGIRIPIRDTVLNYKQLSSSSGAQYVVGQSIFIMMIGPNQSISFNYAVSGITNINPVKNGSVMQSLVDTENILSFNDIRISLLKSEIEDVSAGGHVDTRVVTVRVENPTAVDVTINSIEVIKTPSIDITDVMRTWTFPLTKQNIVVPAGGVWEDDIYDRDAHDGEVYWMDYEVEVYKVIFNFNAQNLMEVNVTLIQQLNRTDNTTLPEDPGQYIFILKQISSSVVQPGDIVNVLLTILNTGNIPSYVNIYDIIPQGFVFYSTPSGTAEGNVFKDAKAVGAGQTIMLNYSLKYIGDGQVGLGFFDGATLKVGGSNITSGKISFIKEYLPKEKLFVQKKVTHTTDDSIKIELILKNIGQSVIKNIILKEPLSVEDRFELISRSALEKGVWSIQEIAPNQEFTVEYVTGSETKYNVLPNIFGLNDEEVYKTLITDTILKNIFTANKISSIEIVGIAFVFVFIISMLFINFGFLGKLQASIQSATGAKNSKTLQGNISNAGDAIRSLKQELGGSQNQNISNTNQTRTNSSLENKQ